MASVAGVHDRAREIARPLGQPVLAWHATYHEAGRRSSRRRDRGRGSGRRSPSPSAPTAGEPDAFAIYGGQILCIRWHQGRLDELLDLLEGAAAETQIAAYKGAHAMALAEAGRTDDVADRIGAEMAAGWPGLHPDNVWLVGVVSWAEAAAHTGHRAAAEHLLAILEAYPEQVATTGASVHGPVAHQIGILHRTLGHVDQAISWLTEARRIADAIRDPSS